MSLRIKPVITQACYIIGCSKKLKNVSETRWIWNVPLFINTFFFSAAILVPFPNTLLLKRIITMQKQKSEEDRSPCCWGGGGLCLLFDWGSLHPCPQHLGQDQLICTNFCRDFCCSLPTESNNGEGRTAVLCVCVVMLLAALHSCENSSFAQCFPPFWSLKWQPL